MITGSCKTYAVIEMEFDSTLFHYLCVNLIRRNFEQDLQILNIQQSSQTRRNVLWFPPFWEEKQASGLHDGRLSSVDNRLHP